MNSILTILKKKNDLNAVAEEIASLINSLIFN